MTALRILVAVCGYFGLAVHAAPPAAVIRVHDDGTDLTFHLEARVGELRRLLPELGTGEPTLADLVDPFGERMRFARGGRPCVLTAPSLVPPEPGQVHLTGRLHCMRAEGHLNVEIVRALQLSSDLALVIESDLGGPSQSLRIVRDHPVIEIVPLDQQAALSFFLRGFFRFTRATPSMSTIVTWLFLVFCLMLGGLATNRLAFVFSAGLLATTLTISELLKQFESLHVSMSSALALVGLAVAGIAAGPQPWRVRLTPVWCVLAACGLSLHPDSLPRYLLRADQHHVLKAAAGHLAGTLAFALLATTLAFVVSRFMVSLETKTTHPDEATANGNAAT